MYIDVLNRCFLEVLILCWLYVVVKRLLEEWKLGILVDMEMFVLVMIMIFFFLCNVVLSLLSCWLFFLLNWGFFFIKLRYFVVCFLGVVVFFFFVGGGLLCVVGVFVLECILMGLDSCFVGDCELEVVVDVGEGEGYCFVVLL